MATENTSTPTGTGPLTVHGAAEKFASLLSVDDDGTQQGREALPANDVHEDDEQAEGHEAPEGSEHEGEGDPDSVTEVDENGEVQELPDDTKMVVDGQEVTLHELKRGFLREQDYTRKTQALAEQRRTLEASTQAEAQQARQEREQYAHALGQVQTFMQQLMPREPDWGQLYAEDPARYAAEREAWRSWNEHLQGIEGQRRSLAERAQQEQADVVKKYVEEEKGKLIAALPEWQKPEVAKAEKQKIMEWGQKVGFTENELLGIIDHRALVVARKAMLYDEMMGKKQTLRPTPTKGPKPATPGSSGTKPNRVTDVTRSKQRLAQTGRVRDAAALIDQLLGDEP